jgi:ankyrin repeat protein
MHDGEVDTFTVSTSERLIDPGTVYELPVPLSDPSGGFLVYSWEEKSGEAVRFTVRTDGGRTLLDEVQVRSEGRLCVSESSRLSLCWDNAGAWLKTLNVRYSVKVVSDRGVQNTLRTRLLHAARHGLLSAVEECLDHGVPIEGTNEAGYTPLILAVLGRRQPSVELLLRRGASVATCDRRGNSPLHLASLQRVPGVVRLLLDAKADSLARNQDGMTAAHIAAFTDNAEAAWMVVACAEEAFARDAHANTPLHLAASAGHLAVLPPLLGHGMRAGPNRRGETPLECAARAGLGSGLGVGWAWG